MKEVQNSGMGGQDSLCPLHAQPLVGGFAFVVYGLVRHSNDYLEALQRGFVRSHFVILGGCAVGDQIVQQVMYCEACRVAHVEWCAHHQSRSGLPPQPERLEQVIRSRMGCDVDVPQVPAEALTFAHEGNLADAVRALKAANPGVAISDLRAFIMGVLNATERQRILGLIPAVPSMRP